MANAFSLFYSFLRVPRGAPPSDFEFEGRDRYRPRCFQERERERGKKKERRKEEKRERKKMIKVGKTDKPR